MLITKQLLANWIDNMFLLYDISGLFNLVPRVSHREDERTWKRGCVRWSEMLCVGRKCLKSPDQSVWQKSTNSYWSMKQPSVFLCSWVRLASITISWLLSQGWAGSWSDIGRDRLGSIRNKNNWNNASKRLCGSYSHSGIAGFHSGYSAPRSRIAGIYSGIHSYSGIFPNERALR